jgi:hypothetical protein
MHFHTETVAFVVIAAYHLLSHTRFNQVGENATDPLGSPQWSAEDSPLHPFDEEDP